MDEFIALLMKNLEKNQFPQKRVAFNMEKLYERAENRNLSLNRVLDEMKTRGVAHIKKGEQIIFFNQPTQSGSVEPEGLNPDFLEQAKAMMQNMSEDELSAAQSLVQERLKNMGDDERNQLFENIRKMGLI